jgi:regulator of RNase E activity RraA
MCSASSACSIRRCPAICARSTTSAPVAGIAFTVKSAPNVKITGEMTFRTEMLDEHGRETRFVVWDTSNDEKATLWGGVMTATAVGKGVKAACIDGGIRDTHQIREKDFPVFYKYRIPNGSLGRCLITHYQIPIKIGDVVIKPGDVILADIDGVLCIPRDSPTGARPRRGDPRQRKEDLRLGRRGPEHPPDHGKRRVLLRPGPARPCAGLSRRRPKFPTR